MSGHHFVDLFSYVELVLSTLVLATLVRSKSVRSYTFLTALLSTRVASMIFCLALLAFCNHGLDANFVYHTYFGVYWVSFAVEAVLSLMVILSIFKLAMAPLKGLQTLGMLVFRWAAAISVAVAVGITANPHASGSAFLVSLVTQLQQTSSILILCLLLFVCFAIRPMGLSYRSRIFGVSLGLGIVAAVSLVSSAWIGRTPALYSTFSVIAGATGCLTCLIWSLYFAFPEEKRRIIVLPTTSPFLRWNQISEVLGDEPGFVAIAGIPPEVFAPAEIEVMRRASIKMPSSAPVPVSTEIGLKSLIA